jgi:penicillin-binding protein 1A
MSRAKPTSKRTGRRPGPRKGASKRGKASPKKRHWVLRLLRALVMLGLVAAILGMATAAGALWYYGRDLPPIDSLRHFDPPQTTRVVDRDGELLGEIFTERRTVVPMERIPRVMVLSVLAAEDADFYRHAGLDYPGILRAVVRDVISGRRAQGASTITQQVVKLLLLSSERTLSRKVRELILARRLENQLSKDEILHLYLNSINFGRGHYGVQEAARYYFGKDISELNLAEASLIAGVPQSPARLSPRSHPEAARRRQRFVLAQLEAKREEYWPDLSLEEIQQARDAEAALAPAPERRQIAPEVMSVARRTLRAAVGDEAYRRGGYTVHTTLDADLQRAARTALRNGLQAVDERHHLRAPFARPSRRRRRRALPAVETLRVGGNYVGEVTGADDDEATLSLNVGGHPVRVDLRSAGRYDPETHTASAFAETGARLHVSILELGEGDEPAAARLEVGPEGAVVLIEPRTREILALVGGYQAAPGFDRATRALRQPGSTFKPLVYGQGIRTRRYTPASIVVDAPAVYDQWRPDNYETWRFEGEIRLREGLAKSINLVAVRVMEQVGPESVVSFARELGIQSELDASLSLALGASEVKPVEMVNAYATFAAGGRYQDTLLISAIEDASGQAVALPERAPPRDVLSPAEAFIITSMLGSVVDHGTARRARRLGRPAAGKTGTSNEARDAWFVGYTPSLVAGVWVGYDDHRPLGRRESGGRTALPVWIELMRAATEGRARVDFPEPPGVVHARIDPASGKLAWDGQEDAMDEVFLEGTAPTEVATPPEEASADAFSREQLGAEEGPADAGAEEAATP